MEEPYYDYYEADINAKLQGVLVEELTPLQSTLEETHKNVEGLSFKFVEMETIISTLCKTVDTLQGQIKTKTADLAADVTTPATAAATTKDPFLNTDHALVSQLVARIEHLSADVSHFDTTRHLREDNLLLRKDLQAYQDRERHFINRMDNLEKKITELHEKSSRPRSGQRRRRGSTSGVTSPDPQVPEFPPIGNGNRSKSTTDVSDQNRNSVKAKSKTVHLKQEKPAPPPQQQQQQKQQHQQQQQRVVEEPQEFQQVEPHLRRSLISPTQTTNKISRLRQKSSSSNSSGPEILDLKSPRQGILAPITNKHEVDSLQNEVQVTRSDNSILRQDIQIFRHRENQLHRRTLELEETVLQQNNAILALSPDPGKGDQKTEVKINVDFIDAKDPGGSKQAIVTADDTSKTVGHKAEAMAEHEEAEVPEPEAEAVAKQPLTSKGGPVKKAAAKAPVKASAPASKAPVASKAPAPTSKAPAPVASKAAVKEVKKVESKKSAGVQVPKPGSSSDDKQSSSEDEKKSAPAKPVKAVSFPGKEPASAAAKKPVTNGVPKSKPNGTPAAQKSSKPAPTKGPAKPAEPTGKAAVEAEKTKTPTVREPSGVQRSFMEGDDWVVTISSKHELITSSDDSHQTVTICPRTPPPPKKEEKKAVVKAVAKAVVKAKEKKVITEKKIVDPRSDPIPKPTQYPCARPPRNHIPQRQIPNASPGLNRHSNIAVVSPLPASYDNQYDFIQFNYKQDADCMDLDCAPSPHSICQVSYDSIYDDPMHY